MLGVIIDKDLTWTEHITHVGKIMSRKLFQLGKIKHFLDKQSRKHFFNGHILSIIDYASSVWDNCSNTNLKQINRMYKKAVKLVLLKSSSPTAKDHKELNILNFHDRLFFNKALFMFNVMNGSAPPKITNTFKTNSHRHKNILVFPRPRNNLYKSSLLYSGGTLWNSLPATLKNIKTKSHFKSRLKCYLFNKRN